MIRDEKFAVRKSLGTWALTTLYAAQLVFLAAVACRAHDDWPQYAHDPGLTGRTSLQGDIGQPRHAWSIDLAGEHIDLEIVPATGTHSLSLPADAAAGAQPTVPVPGPRLLDIDGSGPLRPAAEGIGRRWARVLPDVKGYQRISWDQTWTTAKICHLELFAYDNGWDSPRRVWQSEPEDTVFMPLCVVHDIDGDGQQEVCVALHYRVIIYDATTGRKETELRFHSSRSYGWFGLANVDDDEHMELVVLADFQSHWGVLDYHPERPEPERLSVKWHRPVEQQIEKRAMWLQVGPRPLADVTGDGIPEIVVNLFGDSQQARWHTIVLEAATGRRIAALADRYFHGHADVDGDHVAELFCSVTQGALVPTFGDIEIVELQSGEPRVMWSRPESAFGLADLPHFEPTWCTGATQGMQHVLLSCFRPRPVFLVLSREKGSASDGSRERPDRLVRVDAVRYDASGGIRTLWRVGGGNGRIKTLALAEQGDAASARLRLEIPARASLALESRNARPVVLARARTFGMLHAPIAARLAPDGPVEIVVQGGAENVFCVRAPTEFESAATIRWQRPGRGIGNGCRPGTVVAADLDGNGSREIIVADETEGGAAMLKALCADGQPYWKHVFAATAGGVPRHNLNALVYWWPGRFRSPDQVDLFVNTRRGLMHSGEGHLLNGKNGQIVWSQHRAAVPDEFSWGFAGGPVAAGDVHGDAADEIVNLYPVCFWTADGATGRILVGRDLAARKVVPAWAAYGQPILYDFLQNGRTQILLDSVYQLALLDDSGTAVWHGAARAAYKGEPSEGNETTATRHAVIDLDGDGRPEIASAGYRDGVRAIDPVTGEILWSLPAPSPSETKCIAADINGDGGEEIIYVAGADLVAVTGDRREGRVLWSWKGPADLSLPAIADVDGDGKAEIILQSSDGRVHCVDGGS